MRKKSSFKNKNFVSARKLSPYDKLLLETVSQYGGFYNAHAHLDRADTLDDIYLRHINTTPLEASILPLSVKQNLVGDLHRGIAYTKENLEQRMSDVLKRLISCGTTGLATCIDATPDISENGLLAIRIALDLKEKFKDKILMNIAPNPIFGFKEGTQRWEVFKEAAKMCDYLSALPEKDDYSDPKDRDGKVGYRQHLKMVLKLACELKKEVHVHLDQANDPTEKGTETLIECLRWLEAPVIPGQSAPSVWAIHSISPSAYSEERFAKMIDGLLEHNIGIIVCPTAAVSMRQLRPVVAPTHNSIARVLELVKKKVPVLIGTDNICDVFVPQGDGDMLTEVKMGGHAVRLATPAVWAKLAAGTPPNEVDRTTVGRVLWEDRKAYKKADPSWEPALD
jgi:cytosine/adenosine deaminase-related metal-dependent hydrolase